MNRRDFLRTMAMAPVGYALKPYLSLTRVVKRSRVRPGQAGWPTQAEWDKLNEEVGGRLISVSSPLEEVRKSGDKAQADALFKELKNPYYIGDEAGLTQSTGYVNAWTTKPSVYAIRAESAKDVQAAVNFAREHNLRLVVKGGGHSYHGTSCAPDSLLIWTHPMKEITLHDDFVPLGCEALMKPQQAVTVGAGCLWIHVYQEVSVKNGRYVQGGGCCTVGVAGLVQSGGFGSFSKNFGTAASNLIEAEIVTADGAILTVNEKHHPDLFWAVKGGGGGNWGVVTKLTLKTHELPKTLGGIGNGDIKAKSDAAYQKLVTRFLKHYRDHLMNPHWGESAQVRPDNVLSIDMVLQGLTQEQARADWQPFIDWVKASPNDYETGSMIFAAIPGRSFWDGEFWRGFYPANVAFDDRPDAPKENVMWADNKAECGVYWSGYESVWMPQTLLADDQIEKLGATLFEASRWYIVRLHFNKGLAGAPAEAIERSKNTATNPAVLTAFALAIIADGDDPCYAGIPGHEPNTGRANRRQGNIKEAMNILRTLIPNPGSYVSESSYFEKDWHRAYWGANVSRLRAIKKKYDPDCLFFVHNGVSSEEWSEDGFEEK